jgi:hypothetical protein
MVVLLHLIGPSMEAAKFVLHKLGCNENGTHESIYMG